MKADIALRDLRRVIAEIGPMAIGFSAGVDSTLLLKVACDLLGRRVVGITTVSVATPICRQYSATVNIGFVFWSSSVEVIWTASDAPDPSRYIPSVPFA